MQGAIAKMSGSNEDRFQGTGNLILKNGTRKEVAWEVDFLHHGFPGDGVVRGEKRHLKAAVKDGFAKLQFEPNAEAVIVIGQYENGQARFKTWLTSTRPAIFCAQTVLSSSPVAEGSHYSIDFSDANGEQLRLAVPARIMWDFLPLVFHQLKPFFQPESSASFLRIAKEVNVGTTRSHPIVFVAFDGDQPLGLTPAQALEHLQRYPLLGPRRRRVRMCQ